MPKRKTSEHSSTFFHKKLQTEICKIGTQITIHDLRCATLIAEQSVLFEQLVRCYLTKCHADRLGKSNKRRGFTLIIKPADYSMDIGTMEDIIADYGCNTTRDFLSKAEPQVAVHFPPFNKPKPTVTLPPSTVTMPSTLLPVKPPMSPPTSLYNKVVVKPATLRRNPPKVKFVVNNKRKGQRISFSERKNHGNTTRITPVSS